MLTKTKPKELSFKEDLRSNLKQGNFDSTCQKFEYIFMSTLEKHAPLKKKTHNANHVPYMTKALRKAIVKRSSLKNKVQSALRDDTSILMADMRIRTHNH